MAVQRIYYQTEIVEQPSIPEGVAVEDLWKYMKDLPFVPMPKVHSDANDYQKFQPKGFDVDIPEFKKPLIPLNDGMRWGNFLVKDFSYNEDCRDLETVLERKVLRDTNGVVYVD